MHNVRTPWPVATRVQYIVAYEECWRRWQLSARRFCQAAEVPYSTFARWWLRWRRAGDAIGAVALAALRASLEIIDRTTVVRREPEVRVELISICHAVASRKNDTSVE